MPAALSVDKSLSQARQAAKKQDWLTAVLLNKSVLERFPANKKAAKALTDMRAPATQGILEGAKAAQAKEDWRLAHRYLEAAHFLAPELPEIRHALVECCFEAKAPNAALKLIDEVLQKEPGDLRYLIYQGQALHELNRPDAARNSLAKALDLSPDNVSAHSVLAVVERSQGDLAKAQTHFEAALRSAPHDVGLIRNLSVLKSKCSADDPVIAQAKQALAILGKDNERSAFLHFALFDLLDKCDEREAAFDHLLKGNAILARHHPFDFKSEAFVGAYSKALFADPLPSAEMEETKFIFVTGLPRTGTTLTERILARAQGVQAGGELNIVSSAVLDRLREMRGRADQRLTKKDIAAMRAGILEGFEQMSDGSPVIVDKMPLNFRWIGYICAALPEARIVHMNRDPQAVAWSLYRHVFQGRGHDFIYTPEDIARFMLFHRDLMAHWRKVCGDRIFELNYSDLVGDQLATTKALAGAVGLEWTEDWLSPEKATNHVRTASVAQVTKPIYAGSDASWKKYEEHLAPLMKALTSAKLI